MKTPKILVAGSLNMDLTAAIKTLPKEGQTLLGNRLERSPGGKGANQAVQAALLGAETTIFGRLGRDMYAGEIIKVCKNSGVDTSLIGYDNNAPTGSAIIILEESEGRDAKNRIMVFPGANMQMTPDDAAFLESEIAKYDMVLLQLEIPINVNEEIARFAHKKGVPVMLNPAPYAPLPESFLSNLDFISPNEHESSQMTGLPITHKGDSVDISEVKAVTSAIRERGVKNVLVTLGNAGAALKNESGFYHVPCVKHLPAADTVAAGDSFVSSFCVGVCNGLKWRDAMNFAGFAAALTVSRNGAIASLPNLAEVKKLMAQ